MENEEKKRITPEKALEILRADGLEITLEQAGKILEIMRKLAGIVISKYLRQCQK